MVRPYPVDRAVARLEERFPHAVQEKADGWILIDVEHTVEVCRFLKEDPEFRFDYLTAITAVDYLDYFEVVYHLSSLAKEHTLVFKSRVRGREKPTVPSVMPVWRGAELQEREIYDLMGIRFAGHPDLRRILLWESYKGHPLRKDYWYTNENSADDIPTTEEV